MSLDRSFPLQTGHCFFCGSNSVRKRTPTWGPLSNVTAIREPIIPVRCFDKCALCGGCYNTWHRAHRPQSSELVTLTDGITKSQLATLVETLCTTWPKALPWVLPNLGSTVFGTSALSRSQIVPGHPARVAPASSDPQPIEGDPLRWAQGLAASIKNNHRLAERCFHGALPGGR